MHPFVHLHVHSQYSLLDGQASIESIVDKAISDGMPGIAITDHGNMFGIKEFINYVNKRNGKRPEGTEPFKPIIGCEMYVAKDRLTTHVDTKDKGQHLIVLAKNRTGYKSLIKLVSKAWTEGFYSHPRTDHYELEAHREGLIVCSACLGGELPQYIMAGDVEKAEQTALWYKSIFGDDYYIEIQRHKADVQRANHETYEEQQRVNPVLIDIARRNGIKIVCTNDCHFTNREDAEAHDRLICLSTGRDFDDPQRMLYTKQEWVKTTAEMNELFADIPEALDGTIDILNKVETYSIDHAPIMPFFEIPPEFGTEEEYRARISEQELFDEFTRDENGNVVLSEEEARKKIDKLGGYDKLYRIKFEADYLAKLAYEGAKRRYGDPLTPEIEERIKFELHIMKTMGFPGYFLIVQDFINVARSQLGVSVGPGRGSAAGSCVAYCLGITQIDPIKYDLLFERFLNPDRISLPDIDIDFDDDGRADVLQYVTEKYGAEKVAHIITYGTMASKSAIKDVARVMKLPLPESNRLAKMVPAHMPEVNGKELKTNLKNCYEYVDDFKQELRNPDPLVQDTLKYALQLEGNVRNTGVHACGVIICRDDITDWVPVSTATDKNGKQLVTQYEGRVIEETGLIKMDFLGLKTLSIIKQAVDNIRLTRGIDIDMDTIPIDDPATYRLYSEGRTKGTFQFESAGMQKYLRELHPSTFEDLIAMNALYRPGPMDYIPEFIDRKHGRSPIIYDIPEMEQYLKDTYGVTVYQEQVMLLSRLLAGFTRGESDTLRKAMGKKLIDKMNALKSKFLSGGQERGHDLKVLEKIWADWEKFASYAFNKSHATCYSWVAYQTAWLKANYPAEYMASVLTSNRSDNAKLANFMDECKSMRIQVKGPDVNESFVAFGVNSAGDIRFGLGAVKGVGDNVVHAIIEARRNGGPFKDIFDFVERVPSGAVNRRTFEALALSGAFDCFEGTKREDFFEPNSRGETAAEALLHYGQVYQRAKAENTVSLFDGFMDATATATAARPDIKPATPWIEAERLEKERELVGMYLSAHPLDPYFMELNYACTPIKDFNALSEPTEGTKVTFGGMVVSMDIRTSRRGGKFGILKVEDYSGSTEIMLFGDQFISYNGFGIPGTPVVISGEFKKRYSGEVRFNVSSMQLLDHIKGKLIEGIQISVPVNKLDALLESLIKEHISKYAKDTSGTKGWLNFKVFEPTLYRNLVLKSEYTLNINRELIDMIIAAGLDFEIHSSLGVYNYAETVDEVDVEAEEEAAIAD